MAKKKRKAARRPAKKKAAKKKITAKKMQPKAAVSSGLSVKLPPSLEARMRMLGTKMGKSLGQVLVQAASEFAETWEDHLRTVAALQDQEERVQLSVPKE